MMNKAQFERLMQLAEAFGQVGELGEDDVETIDTLTTITEGTDPEKVFEELFGIDTEKLNSLLEECDYAKV